MMKFLIVVFTLLSVVVSCAHYETANIGRTPSSTADASDTNNPPRWENNVCVLKGESREQDFVVRFSDVHSLCPQLRDYNSAGAAYTKMKNQGRGIYIPACQPQRTQASANAARCWMGFDVFGQSAGSCTLAQPQVACSSCQCDGRSGIAWQ